MIRLAALRAPLVALFALLPLTAAAASKKTAVRVDHNLVYGMVSGAALLLDVYRPAKPNGFGVVFIAGR